MRRQRSYSFVAHVKVVFFAKWKEASQVNSISWRLPEKNDYDARNSAIPSPTARYN
jgi:hypothetical protein